MATAMEYAGASLLLDAAFVAAAIQGVCSGQVQNLPTVPCSRGPSGTVTFRIVLVGIRATYYLSNKTYIDDAILSDLCAAVGCDVDASSVTSFTQEFRNGTIPVVVLVITTVFWNDDDAEDAADDFDPSVVGLPYTGEAVPLSQQNDIVDGVYINDDSSAEYVPPEADHASFIAPLFALIALFSIFLM
jgi:hypothetical protein